jgi:pimeloyl-ACP methyl ester carboxylesterase
VQQHLIRRGFGDTSFGQVHYRYAGSGAPLLLCHASPGSSKQLEPLIAQLARTRRVIAPDTPGNGDSSPLPMASPIAVDFAGAILEFLDVIGIDCCDAYGSHTGTAILSEIAILAPDRLRRIVLDGMAVFTAAQREEYLRHYALPFNADLEGAYLLRAFMFCRDQYLFFPWYARDREHRRDRGLPPPDQLHEWVLEVLKANDSYHLAYRAAFSYAAAERARLIRHPVLALTAEDDPLRAGTQSAVSGMPDGRYLTLPPIGEPGHDTRLADAIVKFLELSDAAVRRLRECDGR